MKASTLTDAQKVFVIARVLDLASCDLADHPREADGVGGALLSTWAFRHFPHHVERVAFLDCLEMSHGRRRETPRPTDDAAQKHRFSNVPANARSQRA